MDGLRGQEKKFAKALIKELAKGESEEKAASIAKKLAKNKIVKRATKKV